MKILLSRIAAVFSAAVLSLNMAAQCITVSAANLPGGSDNRDLLDSVSLPQSAMILDTADLDAYGENEEFAIVPACAGNATLDHARSNGTVILYHIDRTATQRWKLRKSDGYYYIESGVDGKVMDVSGGNTANGAQIVLSAKKTGGSAVNQLWRLTSAGDGTYLIRSKMDDSKVIDVSGYGTADWTKIQLWDVNAGPNQRFRFVPLSTVEPESEWGASRHDCNVSDFDIWDGTCDYGWYFNHPTDSNLYIGTGAELFGLTSLVANNYSFLGRTVHLTRDINLAGIEWTPIGTTYAFNGSFNGEGHAIIGLSITQTNNYQGLFGRTQYGTICNLAVKGNVSGDDHVGGVVGQIDSGALINIYSEVAMTKATDAYAGGIAGVVNWNAYVEHCTQNARVNSYDKDPYRGGIAGIFRGVMRYCVNMGTVDCNWDYVGGIAGQAENAKIEHCMNRGEVCGGGDTEYAGGIAGHTKGSTIVFGCTNYGYIHSDNDDYIGGIVGLNESNQVWCCINHGDVHGDDYVGGITGKNGCLYCLNRGYVTGDSYSGAVCGEQNMSLICCRALAWTNPYLTGNGENGSEWASAADIMNGKVCYALNGLGAGNALPSYGITFKNLFRQNVGSDPYPTFSGAPVTSASGGNSDYHVTVTAQKGYGTVTGGGVYTKGKAVALIAEPADGCVFDHFEITSAVVAQREMYSGSHDYVITQTSNSANATLELTKSIDRSYTVNAVFKPYDDVPDDLRQRVKIELEVTNESDGWNSDKMPVYLVDSAGEKHLWEPNSSEVKDDYMKISHTFDLGAASPVAVYAYPDFGGGLTHHDLGMKARMWINNAGSAMESSEVTIHSWPFMTSLYNDDYMHFSFENYGNATVGLIGADGTFQPGQTFTRCTDAWSAASKLGSKGMLRLDSAWLLDRMLELPGSEFTVDLNGYPMIRTLKKTTDNGGLIKLTNGGKLHITDSNPASRSSSAFTGGSIQGGRSADVGGLIHVESGCTLDMNGGALYNGGTDDKGGGAIWNRGTVSLQNVLIANCWAYGGRSTDNCGGAVRTDYGAATSLKNCSVRACYAQDIGGAFMVKDGTLNLDEVVIAGCESRENEGGAIHLEDSTLNFTNGSVKRCSALADEAGAIYSDGSEINCNKVLFDGNYTEDNGGAIYVTNDSAFHLQNCTFSGNHADDDGGAVYVNQLDGNKKKGYITDCKFTGNVSLGEGGAAYIYSSLVKMDSVEMTGNQASSGGGAVYLRSGYHLGVQGKMIVRDNTADGSADNLFVGCAYAGGNHAYLTNGGLLEGSDLHLTPDSNSSYAVFNEISKAQTKYITVDNGKSTLEKTTEKEERFVSSVIGEGKIIAILVGLFAALIAIIAVVLVKKHSDKNQTEAEDTPDNSEPKEQSPAANTRMPEPEITEEPDTPEESAPTDSTQDEIPAQKPEKPTAPKSPAKPSEQSGKKNYPAQKHNGKKKKKRKK